MKATEQFHSLLNNLIFYWNCQAEFLLVVRNSPKEDTITMEYVSHDEDIIQENAAWLPTAVTCSERGEGPNPSQFSRVVRQPIQRPLEGHLGYLCCEWWTHSPRNHILMLQKEKALRSELKSWTGISAILLRVHSSEACSSVTRLGCSTHQLSVTYWGNLLFSIKRWKRLQQNVQ